MPGNSNPSGRSAHAGRISGCHVAQRSRGRARVLASGELDSTLSLWTDVAQVGGPGQDPSNFLIFAAERQIAFGCDADSGRVAELWLRALNAPLLVVHGAASREYFHWYAQAQQIRRASRSVG